MNIVLLRQMRKVTYSDKRQVPVFVIKRNYACMNKLQTSRRVKCRRCSIHHQHHRIPEDDYAMSDCDAR